MEKTFMGLKILKLSGVISEDNFTGVVFAPQSYLVCDLLKTRYWEKILPDLLMIQTNFSSILWSISWLRSKYLSKNKNGDMTT